MKRSKHSCEKNRLKQSAPKLARNLETSKTGAEGCIGLSVTSAFAPALALTLAPVALTLVVALVPTPTNDATSAASLAVESGSASAGDESAVAGP